MGEKGIATAVVAAVIIIILVVAGIGAYFMLRGPEGGAPPGGEGETIEPATLTQVTSLIDAGDPDWSPDGSQIVFWDFAANRIGIINVDGTGLRYLDISDPSWSPVENKIACVADPSWSPVENKIAYIANNQIYTINSSGGDNTQLTTEEGASGDPAWSPDGTKIAYARWYGGENVSIWVMNADGGGKTQITAEENEPCREPSFSYDGSKIVYIRGRTSSLQAEFEYGANEIWVMDNDGSNKHCIYAPTDISSLIFQRAWNKDNKILFMYRVIQKYGACPSVWVINSDGSDPHPVVQNPSYVYGDPVWSNDGTKVAVGGSPIGDEAQPSDVFVFSWEESL